MRAVWQSSHQKELLDNAWLARLLVNPVSGSNDAAAALTQVEKSPQLDWGNALALPAFYGRAREIELLTQWVVEERCRVVSVMGLGGVGKSALAASLMHRVAERFDAVIWRASGDMPSSEVLFDKLLEVLAPELCLTEPLKQLPASLEQREDILLEKMRSRRVLLVLDGLEAISGTGGAMGRMGPGYEGLERFLRLSAETDHRSCVLLTSRENASVLVAQEGNRSPVRALRLGGLDGSACNQILAEKEIAGSPSERAQLIAAYTGNPLALKIVTKTIVDLFGGVIGPFLEQGEVVFGGVRELIDQQFARLTALEQFLLFLLAMLVEPSTLDELAAVLVKPVPRAQLLEAVEGLSGRSLIEHGQKAGSFRLQALVQEYMTAKLGFEVSSENGSGLSEQSLDLAQASVIQERLLVSPIMRRLRGTTPDREAVEKKMLVFLNQLASLSER